MDCDLRGLEDASGLPDVASKGAPTGSKIDILEIEDLKVVNKPR